MLPLLICISAAVLSGVGYLMSRGSATVTRPRLFLLALTAVLLVSAVYLEVSLAPDTAGGTEGDMVYRVEDGAGPATGGAWLIEHAKRIGRGFRFDKVWPRAFSETKARADPFDAAPLASRAPRAAGDESGVTCSVPSLEDNHSRALLPRRPKLRGCSRRGEDDPIFATVAVGSRAVRVNATLCAGGVWISHVADEEVSELRWERVLASDRAGVGSGSADAADAAAAAAGNPASVGAFEIPPGQDFAFVRCETPGPAAPAGGPRPMKNLVFAGPDSEPARIEARKDAARKRWKAASAPGAWGEPVKQRPNFVILLLDAVSRRQMERTMPKTSAFLASRATGGNRDGSGSGNGNGGDRATARHVSFNFTRYHAVGTRTPPNVAPMLGGRAVNEMRRAVNDGTLDIEREWFFDLLRSLGYVTSFGENCCHKLAGSSPTIFFPGPIGKNLVTLAKRFDHSGLTDAACHIADSLGRTTFYNGPAEACVHGRYLHEYYLDYASRFLDAYAGVPRAALVTLIEGHEQTNKRTYSIDDAVAAFLRRTVERSEARGEDTVVVTYSDHGVVYGNYFEKSAAGRQENALPLLHLTVPRSILSANGGAADRALRGNHRRLLTHYDTHATMRHLLTYPDPRPLPAGHAGALRGISLLGPAAVRKTRTCAEARIPGDICACAAWREFVGDPGYVAEFVTAEMNRAASENGATGCAPVRFASVVDAVSTPAPSSDPDVTQRLMRVEFTVEGGDEIFLAHVYHITWRFRDTYNRRTLTYETLKKSKIIRVTALDKSPKCHGATRGVAPTMCLCRPGRGSGGSNGGGGNGGGGNGGGGNGGAVAAGAKTRTAAKKAPGGLPLRTIRGAGETPEPEGGPGPAPALGSPYERLVHVRGEGGPVTLTTYTLRDHHKRTVVLSFEVRNNNDHAVCVSLTATYKNMVPLRPLPAEDRIPAKTSATVLVLRVRDVGVHWSQKHSLKWWRSVKIPAGHPLAARRGHCQRYRPPGVNESFRSGEVLMTFSDAVQVFRFATPESVVYQVRNSRSMDVQFTLNLVGPMMTTYTFPVIVTVPTKRNVVVAQARRPAVVPREEWPSLTFNWHWKTVSPPATKHQSSDAPAKGKGKGVEEREKREKREKRKKREKKKGGIAAGGS